MDIDKPEDFYKFYGAFKRYSSPVVKAKQIRWYDREFWRPARCTPDNAVLELGSGAGEFLLYLQRKTVARFIGVEMERDAISYLPAELKNHVVAGDIWDFLKDATQIGKWDRIVMLDVLEHFSFVDGARLLQQANRLLAPGGLIVARVPNMGSPWGGMNQFADVTHKAAYTANSLEQIGQAAGLEVEAFLPQKRGSIVRRFLEDCIYACFARIVVTKPLIWTPNIIVIWRQSAGSA